MYYDVPGIVGPFRHALNPLPCLGTTLLTMVVGSSDQRAGEQELSQERFTSKASTRHAIAPLSTVSASHAFQACPLARSDEASTDEDPAGAAHRRNRYGLP